MSEEIIINITGNLVALGPLRKDLVVYYNKWNNDFQITRTLAVTRLSLSKKKWPLLKR